MTALWLAVTMSFVDPAGTKVNLNEPGVVYLVDFWAAGCKPCIEEIPELERLAREFEYTGRFRLVSVLWGGWRGKKLTEFAERYRVGRTLHSDPEKWLESLGEPAFPTKVLVRDGDILEVRTGGGAGSGDYWRAAVARALAAPVPAR